MPNNTPERDEVVTILPATPQASVWGYPWFSASEAVRVANTLYVAAINVPTRCTLTGVQVANGGTITGNIQVALYSYNGLTLLGLSSSTVRAGAYVGQPVPFTTPYGALPGTYFVACQPSLSTGTFSLANMLTSCAGQVQGGFVIPVTITPPAPTDRVTNVPIMTTY